MNESAGNGFRFCAAAAAASGGGSRSRPASHSAVDETSVRLLSRLFASEPELILACLESGDQGQSPVPETVMAAARRALDSRPDYADLHYFTAQVATQMGALDEARGFLKQALHLNPRYRDALVLAARVAIAQGETQEAIDFLRLALAAGADYADVHLMLGDLWREQDQTALARQEYERALELNDGLTLAQQGLTALGIRGDIGGGNELPA